MYVPRFFLSIVPPFIKSHAAVSAWSNLQETQTLLTTSKIVVGYQEREDTYTKKLAYIIYYDNKGVLRKEKSWRGWIDSGDSGYRNEYVDGKYTRVLHEELVRGPLPTHEFENVPTEGFVLNKKAGGYSTGWNHRAASCRVWDP